MPTQTTDHQILAMRTMCSALDLKLVKRAHVDDWGRFGNFVIMVVPQTADRHTTVRLKAAIKKLLPSGAHIRQCFSPDPVYERRYSEGRKVTGYARQYWSFDIDFQRYDSDTNCFQEN